MFGLIMGIVLVAFVAIFICVAVSDSKSKAAAKHITENLIAENGLTVTTKIETFLLDENKKCWIINGIDYLFKYDDIIDFKYEEIGGQIAKASATTRTLYGTAVTSQISGMSVVIHTKVSKYPALYVHFIMNMVVKTDSVNYRLSKSNAEALIAKLTQITSENSNAVQSGSNSSTADEIAKYKSLLDNGAITQEEYDKKKKELLNI